MRETVDVDEAARQHVLSVLEADDGIQRADPDWPEFVRRLDAHFPDLCRLFHSLYGSRPDWQDQLGALVLQCARSWQERPAGLKMMDAEREGNSSWFQSNRMLGGVCYVEDRKSVV